MLRLLLTSCVHLFVWWEHTDNEWTMKSHRNHWNIWDDSTAAPIIHNKLHQPSHKGYSNIWNSSRMWATQRHNQIDFRTWSGAIVSGFGLKLWRLASHFTLWQLSGFVVLQVYCAILTKNCIFQNTHIYLDIMHVQYETVRSNYASV